MKAADQKTVIWVIVGLNCLGNTIVTTYLHRETAEVDLCDKQQAHPEIRYQLVEVDFDATPGAPLAMGSYWATGSPSHVSRA